MQVRHFVYGVWVVGSLCGSVLNGHAVQWTPTPTPSPTATSTLTPTVTHTPDANVYWQDTFVGGVSGQHVAGWEDAGTTPGFNANIVYVGNSGRAAVKRVGVGTWGKVLSPLLQLDITDYIWVEVSSDGSNGATWKVGVQEMSGAYRYWDLSPSLETAGPLRFNLAQITGLHGPTAFKVQITVEGGPDYFVGFNSMRVFQDIPTPTSTMTPTFTATPTATVTSTPVEDRWALVLNQYVPSLMEDLDTTAAEGGIRIGWRNTSNGWTALTNAYLLGSWGTQDGFGESSMYGRPGSFRTAGSVSKTYIAWNTYYGYNQIYVKNGAVWNAVPNTFVRYTKLMDIGVVGDTPYVASVVSGYLYVFRKEEGAAWVQMHEALNSAPWNVTWARLATTPEGGLYVAYVENGKLYVKQWNGQLWAQLGGALNIFADHVAFKPEISAVGGHVCVAWQDSTDQTADVVVKSWDNGEWRQLGTSLNEISTQAAQNAHIALTSGGVPYVIWVENNKVLVRHWNGSEWVWDGTMLNVGRYNPITHFDTQVTEVSLVASGGDLYAAWLEMFPVSFMNVKRLTLDPMATATPTVTVTPTGTATATCTPTATLTPVPENAWSDEFTGVAGEQPYAWLDETFDSGFNAELVYTAGGAQAMMTRTAEDVWGKTQSPLITCEVSTYSEVEVSVTSVTPDTRWKLGVQNGYWPWQYCDLYASNEPGTVRVNFAQVIGWTGYQTFRIQLTVEGSAGKNIVVDWIRVCRPGTVHGASAGSGIGIKSIATSPTYTTTPTPSPTPTITATNTPEATASPTSTPTTGVKVDEGQVIAFPNPARGKVTFAYAAPNVAKVKIDIYRLTGERVASIEEPKDGSEQTFTTAWQAAGVAPGVYFCRIVATDAAGKEVLNVKKKVALVR